MTKSGRQTGNGYLLQRGEPSMSVGHDGQGRTKCLACTTSEYRGYVHGLHHAGQMVSWACAKTLNTDFTLLPGTAYKVS